MWLSSEEDFSVLAVSVHLAASQIPDKEKPAMGSAGLKVFTRSWDYPRPPTVKGM